MLINREARWLIVTPPKTASTSLRHHFAEFYNGHQHDHEIPADFHGRIYVTCRNPFDRAISLWMHYLWDLAKLRKGYPDPERPERSFDEFLELRPTLTEFFGTAHWWVRHLGKTRVLRTENLENALKREGMLSGEASLPRYNQTRHRPWRECYCRDTAAIVMRDFAVDFEWFGYECKWPGPDDPNNGC